MPPKKHSSNNGKGPATGLPTFSPQENKEWSSSKKTGEILLEENIPEERQLSWIRMYEICEDKKMLKEMGFDTIDSYAAHLRETHPRGKSKNGHGFSTTNFRRYRAAGRVFKELFLANIQFADMPQRMEAAIELSYYSEGFKKGEHSVNTIDIWKAAVVLGGNTRSTTEEHVKDAIKNATIGVTETVEADAAAEIKKLKEDMEAMKKKHKSDIEESKKRALPADIRLEMEEKDEDIKRIKGFLTGFTMTENNTYVLKDNETFERLCPSEETCRQMIKDAFKEPVDETVLETMTKTFTPLVKCRNYIAMLYVNIDGSSFSSEEKRIKVLTETNKEAKVIR